MKFFLVSIFTLMFTLTTAVFTPANRTELKDAVKLCLEETADGNCPTFAAENGNISDWDVSSVTDMKEMFAGRAEFNQYIGDWDVSKVKYMNSMFYGAAQFNQYIGDWDMSNVTTTKLMFYGAAQFNQYIGKWDVSNVKDMIAMFSKAKAFNQYIGGWDVSKVESMQSMFEDGGFNQYIGDWDVSKVKYMNSMFADGSFNQYIGDWDVSNVKEMSRMFEDATVFEQYIGDWDVSNVDNMKEMFSNAKAFNQYIGDWDVSNVTNMNDMFKDEAEGGGVPAAFDKPLDGWYWVKSRPSLTTSWLVDKLELIPEESTVKCAPGYSYSASRPDDCSLCPAGEYQPDIVRNPENDVPCKKCPVGTTSWSGQPECLQCPVGTYQPVEGQNVCLQCPAGTYQPEKGRTSKDNCIECEIDHISEESAAVCERCSVGEFSDDRLECKDRTKPKVLREAYDKLGGCAA
jgi:hypothetical protein